MELLKKILKDVVLVASGAVITLLIVFIFGLNFKIMALEKKHNELGVAHNSLVKALQQQVQQTQQVEPAVAERKGKH